MSDTVMMKIWTLVVGRLCTHTCWPLHKLETSLSTAVQDVSLKYQPLLPRGRINVRSVSPHWMTALIICSQSHPCLVINSFMLYVFSSNFHLICILAVSTCPPAGDLSCFALYLLSRRCGPLYGVFIAFHARILSALAGLCKEFY